MRFNPGKFLRDPNFNPRSGRPSGHNPPATGRGCDGTDLPCRSYLTRNSILKSRWLRSKGARNLPRCVTHAYVSHLVLYRDEGPPPGTTSHVQIDGEQNDHEGDELRAAVYG